MDGEHRCSEAKTVVPTTTRRRYHARLDYIGTARHRRQRHVRDDREVGQFVDKRDASLRDDN